VTTPAALTGGADFAAVTPNEVEAGLAALESAPVNIVLVPGFAPADIASVVEGHLETTLQEGMERIAVLGVTDPGTAVDASDALNDVSGIADDRIVLVTPGLVATDDPTGTSVILPPSYLAAVVGGALAAVAPEVSLTNQTLNVNGIDVQYTRALTEQLLLNRLLVVREKFGYQVVRAITTDTDGFTEISVRRIVDYAKQGIRSAADAFVGQLNDDRVRAALQSTLDGFLSGMVLSQMLVDYNLDVSATPQQQIAGQVIVTINLLPVFSIDYILVTMNLGPVGS
jgi:Phage tail sheath protein subtilisin-like domain/Phage tail sheath C-terminal domain